MSVSDVEKVKFSAGLKKNKVDLNHLQRYSQSQQPPDFTVSRGTFKPMAPFLAMYHSNRIVAGKPGIREALGFVNYAVIRQICCAVVGI